MNKNSLNCLREYKIKPIQIAPIFFILLPLLWGCSNVDKIDSSDKFSTPNTENKIDGNALAKENFRKNWEKQYNANVAELEKHRKMWQEKQILNYDFVVSKWAGGVTNSWNRAAVLIKVRNGEKVSLEKVEKGEDTIVSRTDGFEEIDTVDKLFVYLRRRLDEGALVGGKFNKNLNYPQKITISFSFDIHGYHNIIIEKLEKK